MRFIPLYISWILLSAHFVRSGHLSLSILCLIIPFMTMLKKEYICKSIQWLTYAAIPFWMFVGGNFIKMRIQYGEDYLRLGVIMIAILIFTFWAGWILNPKEQKA